MRLDSPLDDLFASRSHVRVLRALYRLPVGFPASGRELARRSGLTHPTALKAAAALVETGMVGVRRTPSGDEYELNRDHYLVQPVDDLFVTEARVGDELPAFLREEILARTDKVTWAMLFGSAVWGGSEPSSDVDLAVVCKPDDADEVENALEEVSDAVRSRFGNRLSPIISTRARQPKTGIWRRVEEEGVPVVAPQGIST